MAFKQFTPIPHMNFQINRVYTHGEKACDEKELWDVASRVSEFDFAVWFREWMELAEKAEGEGRFMHASYYYRLAEFYLHFEQPEKRTVYEKFKSCFARATASDPIETFKVPYEGREFPGMRLQAANEKGIVILNGGFDSFMEELYLEAHRYLDAGYSVVLFEGPGQGGTLRDGMRMTHLWEKPVSSLLDYLDLEKINLVGISLGGYLALRAAAFEPRIERVVAYDIVWDALACFMRNLPDGFMQMVLDRKKDEINAVINEVRKTNDLVDWAASHGMYVVGADNPFDYFYAAKDYHTRDISKLIRQDVLLLAGENDHLIPVSFFQPQKDALTAARSVSGRIFTAEEGGDQHCQVGNLGLAVNTIIDWLNSFSP